MPFPNNTREVDSHHAAKSNHGSVEEAAAAAAAAAATEVNLHVDVDAKDKPKQHRVVDVEPVAGKPSAARKKAAKKRSKPDNDECSDDDEEYDPTNDRPKKQPRKAKSCNTESSASNKKQTVDDETTPKKRKGRGAPSKFDKMFPKLLEFKKQHGHCKVPTVPRTELGIWVEGVRNQYRMLKRGDGKSSLTVERLCKLTDAGFVFNTLEKPKVKWEERIASCKQFIQEQGHLRIPVEHPELGVWCRETRKRYKRKKDGKKNSLTDEREKQLNELGFVWLAGKPMTEWSSSSSSSKKKKTWDESFQDFVEYKRMHGHPYVPQNLEGGLGKWVSEQRKHYKLLQKQGSKSYMTAEKALKLSNAGFCFDASSIHRTPKSALEEEETHLHVDDDEEKGKEGARNHRWL